MILKGFLGSYQKGISAVLELEDLEDMSDTNVLTSLYWEFIFSICLAVVSHKQDRGCLLKLDITHQVYESMELLFWSCIDVSTCGVDWWLCGWSIIQMVWDEFTSCCGLKDWKRQIGCGMLMTSNISKSDRRSECCALRRRFLRCSCICL